MNYFHQPKTQSVENPLLYRHCSELRYTWSYLEYLQRSPFRSTPCAWTCLLLPCYFVDLFGVCRPEGIQYLFGSFNVIEILPAANPGCKQFIQALYSITKHARNRMPEARIFSRVGGAFQIVLYGKATGRAPNLYQPLAEAPFQEPRLCGQRH